MAWTRESAHRLYGNPDFQDLFSDLASPVHAEIERMARIALNPSHPLDRRDNAAKKRNGMLAVREILTALINEDLAPKEEPKTETRRTAWAGKYLSRRP